MEDEQTKGEEKGKKKRRVRGEERAMLMDGWVMYGDEEEVCACSVEEGAKDEGWGSGWGGDGEGLR